eukprot:scaffold39802_cov27-Prasinocladus_malaysianus.AAC.2
MPLIRSEYGVRVFVLGRSGDYEYSTPFGAWKHSRLGCGSASIIYCEPLSFLEDLVRFMLENVSLANSARQRNSQPTIEGLNKRVDISGNNPSRSVLQL